MRKSRSILILMLALLWGPVTSHCQLESLPGMELFSCSDGSHAGDQPDPCKDQGCCSVESAKYQASRQQDFAPDLDALLAVDSAALFDHPVCLLPSRVLPGAWSVAPPDLSPTWQFSQRTALPGRAPSIAS